MLNLLFQETSNLLLRANVTSQKPVLRKAGDSVLFLVSTSPILPSTSSSSPALLFLSSSPLSILLLFWGGLLSPLTRPCAHRYYWVHLNTRVGGCVSMCVCVRVSQKERLSDLAWQAGFVIQYFKLYSLYSNLPKPLIHSCSWCNGGYSLGSWVHSRKWPTTTRNTSFKNVFEQKQYSNTCCNVLKC